MTKLQMALKILNSDTSGSIKEVLVRLGLENEISLSAFRNLYNNVVWRTNNDTSYCNEIKILRYMNRNLFEKRYISSKEIKLLLWRNDVEISDRTVRRYIDDIKKSGIEIETKNGQNGGYKLVKQVKL